MCNFVTYFLSLFLDFSRLIALGFRFSILMSPGGDDEHQGQPQVRGDDRAS